MADVRRGQVWSDNYPGEGGKRHVEVLVVMHDIRPNPSVTKHGSYAQVVVRNSINTKAIGRKTWIRLDRFKPGRNGYTLVRDAE
jgi:hypothetical protein